MRQLTEIQWAVLQHLHHHPGAPCREFNERTLRSLVRADLTCEHGDGYDLTERGRERLLARTIATS